MLKKSAVKRIITSSLAFIIMLLFCLFPKNNELTVPEEVIYVDELTMPLYVKDSNDYVARATVMKNEKEVNEVDYIIGMLTINSELSKTLPDGFVAVIPEGTKVIDYTIEDKIIKINFTKEFLNITPQNEEKMLESLVYSLCEVDGIAGVIIYVENSMLDHYPTSNKKLPAVLDRNIGINKAYSIDNIKGTKMTTTYFISKYQDNYYYIPISKISNDDAEAVEIIISELKSAPIYETNLISYLNASYELEDYEILEDSITLSFNNSLIAGLNDKDINEQVKYTLALSLRDTYNIDDITLNL